MTSWKPYKSTLPDAAQGASSRYNDQLNLPSFAKANRFMGKDFNKQIYDFVYIS